MEQARAHQAGVLAPPGHAYGPRVRDGRVGKHGRREGHDRANRRRAGWLNKTNMLLTALQRLGARNDGKRVRPRASRRGCTHLQRVASTVPTEIGRPAHHMATQTLGKSSNSCCNMARDGAGHTRQRGGRRARAAACERERARRGIGAQALGRAHIERIGKGGHEGVTAVEVACKLRFLVFYHDDGTFRGFGVLRGRRRFVSRHGEENVEERKEGRPRARAGTSRRGDDSEQRAGARGRRGAERARL